MLIEITHDRIRLTSTALANGKLWWKPWKYRMFYT